MRYSLIITGISYKIQADVLLNGVNFKYFLNNSFYFVERISASSVIFVNTSNFFLQITKRGFTDCCS